MILLMLLLASCGARRNTTVKQAKDLKDLTAEKPPAKADETPEVEFAAEAIELAIIDHALDFLGTVYKYGGTSSAGIDCSGLVYTAFLQKDIPLPRSSRDMAKQGEHLELDEVRIGDLLFFITNKRRKTINHVGLVVELAEDLIYFIHSTTSAGVIISTLNEQYWQEHFVMARRIL